MDTPVGLYLASPQLAYVNGLYRLSYEVADLSVPYRRCARSVSADTINWSDGLEDAPQQTYGAAWLRHASGELLLGTAARYAPAYTAAASQYRDLTEDIVGLEVAEREGAAAALTVTLDDTDGHLVQAPYLKANAQLLLSQGFTGTELIATHLCYLQSWTVVRAADVRRLVLRAADRLSWLERPARRPRVYSNGTVTAIAANLAAAGGVDHPLVVDAAAQYSAVVPTFAMQAGEPYVRALARLLALYDGTFRVEVRAGTGTAFGWIDQLHLVAKSSGDAVLHTVDAAVESLQVTVSGGRANRVAVYWTWVPVLQGRAVEQYLRHAADYAAAGLVRPFMAIGSLCRRTQGAEVLAIVQALSAALPGTRFHLFGVKVGVLAGVGGLPAAVASADTAAWNGRFGRGLARWQWARQTRGLSEREWEREQLYRYREKVEAALRQKGTR